MYLVRIATIFFLFSLSLFSLAQEKEITYEPQEKKKKHVNHTDTNYVRQYPSYLMLGVYTATPLMNVQLAPFEDSLSKFRSDYTGNYSAILGFHFGYRHVGFNIGFKTPVDPLSVDSKGKSSYRVLGIKIKKLPFIIFLDYRRYKGFYDVNTSSYDTTHSKELPYNVRQDLTMTQYSASAICNLSWRKYSFTAPTTYTDRQLRTRAGFVMKGALSYVRLQADSSLVTNFQSMYFTDFYGVKEIDAVVFKSGPGLGLNVVIAKRVYFSLTAFLMGNFLRYRYQDNDGEYSSWRNSNNFFTEGSVALGYNSKRLYFGLRGAGDVNLMKMKDAQVKTSFGTVCIDLGYRFGCPGFIRKPWEKILTRYLGL